MPGTLMFEGCLQAMAFYLSALGFTLERDGWLFEPVPEQPYQMRCRGQVLPSSSLLVYEIFVEELVGGPQPTLYADLLCTVDGLKAFHCRRMALRLAPGWPLDTHGALAKRPPDPEPVASSDGFPFDYASLLACAWGKPSAAFGPPYRVFDNHRRVARLPGPPYHFLSRVTHIDGTFGDMTAGSSVEVAYDMPPDAWYFEENGCRSMPFCVLMEAALQPCGWLASFVGSALTSQEDLCFRNLDGTGTLLRELLPGDGTLRTRAKITNISQSAGMIIESFEVSCFVDDELVYEMSTVFGFFPAIALQNQQGLSTTDEQRALLDAPSERSVNLASSPEAYCGGRAKLARPFLRMLDRISGIWPRGGVAGLGRYRGEKDVGAEAWFFKAHFFQDPVQPGSLGIEAMVQLLQFAMLDRGMAEGLGRVRFESIAVGKPLTWKYRGQVVPRNKLITTTLDITEIGRDEQGPFAVAEASLWVDGMRIYEASNLAMRVVSTAATDGGEELLDPSRDTWLADHCPTWTLPALPMMSMVDRMAAAALAHVGSGAVVEVCDVLASRWLVLGEPVRVRTEVTASQDGFDHVVLSAWRESSRPELSRFEPVASARVRVAATYDELAPPAPLPPLEATGSDEGGAEPALPYSDGSLFHGPAFQLLRSVQKGEGGSRTELDASGGSVPLGVLNQALLDAATHGIPHDALSQWSSDIGSDLVAYPYRIARLQLFGPTPSAGKVRCETRFAGFDGEPRLPMFQIQLWAEEKLWCAFSLTEVLLPKGPIGMAPPPLRRAFLRDRQPVPGLGLSHSDKDGKSQRCDDDRTSLSRADLKASDWLPGTVAALYEAEPQLDLLTQVAVKDHVARRAAVHPATVRLLQDAAVAAARPLRRYPLRIQSSGSQIVVHDAGEPTLDITPVRAFWDEHFAVGRWPVEDLYYGLIERFVGEVHIEDPSAFEAIRGRSALFLANHQVAIESLLFSIIASALSGVPTLTLAKEEHRSSWLGLLIKHCFSYPGVVDPQVITYFDRSNPDSLQAIIADLAAQMMVPAGRSVMVHVEGTRSLSCRQPVLKMTSAFIDMALATRCPIVPVRFVGALPQQPLAERIEVPVGMGRQDIWIGRPIHPERFEALGYKDRKPIVIDGINRLGPPNAIEQPLPPDPEFAARVDRRIADSGASAEHAMLLQMLLERHEVGSETRALLDGAASGQLRVADDPKGRWLAELASRLYGPRGAQISR